MGNQSSRSSDPNSKGRRPRKPSQADADAPPPYSPTDSGVQGLSRQAEDSLDTLRAYDTWILVDDSGSMSWNENKRWNEARDALVALADAACRYDADGIDVYFLNHPDQPGLGLKSGASILDLFNRVKPLSTTPIGRRLEELLRPYLLRIEKAIKNEEPLPKPLNVLIITDGEPSDDPESVIVATAKRLDKNDVPLSQLGLQFVQVGNDAKAAQYLRNLDDQLSGTHKIRDMVDTTCSSTFKNQKLTADALVKALVGGINRRVDKKGHGLLTRGH